MKTNVKAVRCTEALERLSDDISLFQMQGAMGGRPSKFLAERMADLQASIAAELEERRRGLEPEMETEDEAPEPEHERAA